MKANDQKRMIMKGLIFMKKLTKTLISSVCAVSMLAGAAMPASACDLTAEELFEKYSFAYFLDWNEQFGYYYIVMYNDKEENITCYDADGNVCNIGSMAYFTDNDYRFYTSWGSGSPVYTCEFEDGFYYAIKDDGTAVIAGCDYDDLMARTSTAMIIPEEIGGAVVTEIASHAFDSARADWKELTSISIPDTVEIIRAGAFYGVFPIGEEANCSINIPKNINYIGSIAYGGYTALALGDVIVLPECTEFVATYAFGQDPQPIKMPESLVFTDHLTIGHSGRYFVNRNEPDEYDWKHYNSVADIAYVDGKYNTVTLFDLRKYLIDKMTQQKPADALTAGDLNTNGEIDLSDAILLARAVGGSYELSAAERAAADLTGDNAVDAADLSALLAILAGK